MIGGYFAAQMRLAGGGGTPWTPLNMATVPQIYLDGQDSTITELSGFAWVWGNLGSLGSNGSAAAPSGERPTILDGELNGKRVLSFDGTDDMMKFANDRDIFKNVGAMWTFIVYKKRGTDGSPTLRTLIYSRRNSSTAPRLAVHAGSFVAGTENKPYVQASRRDADSITALQGTTALSGSYCMLGAFVNVSTAVTSLYVNGTLDATNSSMPASSGLTQNLAAYDSTTIGGSYSGAYSDVDIAAVIISNTYPSTDDIDRLFGWAAHKYGLTANLPGGHPYKSAAPTI